MRPRRVVIKGVEHVYDEAKPKPKKVRWRKVSAPRVWSPKAGEEIIGFYVGRTVRNGQYGQYDVVAIAVPDMGVVMISGTMFIQLVDAAMLVRGDAVRVVYNGLKPLADGAKGMKVFELYVSDGTITETELAKLAGEALFS